MFIIASTAAIPPNNEPIGKNSKLRTSQYLYKKSYQNGICEGFDTCNFGNIIFKMTKENHLRLCLSKHIHIPNIIEQNKTFNKGFHNYIYSSFTN